MSADGADPGPGFHLDVGDGHRLWVEIAGAAGGIPAVFLHGGPGGGFQPGNRALFDPGRYQTLFFDQRGAGRSLPKTGLNANTTPHLIADIERLRLHLGVERWLVVGGSWGATLALAYAMAHPQHVSGLVLRAVFLGTRAELDWAFGEGLRRYYPALHQDFLAVLPPEERADPLPHYFRRILHPDPAVHLPAALGWHDTERILSDINPGVSRLSNTQDRARPNSPFVEAHYFSQGCFLTMDLLAEAARLRDIPGIIVQGRYDLLCPPMTSHALAERWGDGVRVEIAPVSGHSLAHPAVFAAVKAAIAAFDGAAFAPGPLA